MGRIFIGPSPAGITGQSVAFECVAKLAKSQDLVLHYSAWGDRFLAKLRRFLGSWVRCVIELAKRRPRVVYITTSRSRSGFIRDAFFVLSARAFGAPVVNHLHGSDFLHFRERSSIFFRGIIDFVYTRIDCSIILSPVMEEQYHMYPKMDIRVVPNFVSNELLIASYTRSNERRNNNVELIFFSNVIADKGIVETIRAVDALVAQGAPVRLTIVGEREESTPLDLARRVLGNRYSFGAHIRDCGPIHGTARASVLNAADIFVLPSYHNSEAFPLAAIEAMLFGCVLVLSNFRYLPAIFGGFGARFVAPKAWEELRDCLGELVADKSLREKLGNINRLAATKQFTESAYLQRIDAVLDEFELTVDAPADE